MDNNIIRRNIILRFSADMVDQPLVYLLVKEFDLIPNIIRASVNPDKQGQMVLNISGYERDYQRAIEYMQSAGMEIQFLMNSVDWDREKCTDCGACVALCPAQALTVSRPDMRIAFDGEKCVVCQICVQACPVRAMSLNI